MDYLKSMHPDRKYNTMKQMIIIMLSFLAINAVAQSEKTVSTKAEEVTVFLEGAQVVRTKSIDLQQGESVLKFVKLSPYIDSKSIQVKADGSISVLSVNLQQNFIDTDMESQQLEVLRKQLDEVEKQIKIENAHLQVLKEDILFLQENRDFGGHNEALNVENLKNAAGYYSNRLTLLKIKEIERNEKIKDLTKQADDVRRQFSVITSTEENMKSEIWVKVESKTSRSVSFELSYFVENAGWFPSYDIRAKSINKPINIIYKANVHQETKEDWNNVKLHFSTAEPNLSGVAPQLKTYYLGYNTLPPVYGKEITRVQGHVYDRSRNPLVGVNVRIEGTTIGTVTDYNGRYSITIPSGASNLVFTYVGYTSKIVPISGSQIDVILYDKSINLNEDFEQLQVSSVDEALQGRIAGLDVANSNKRLSSKPKYEAPLPPRVQKVENQTSAQFDVEIPYTIKSENKITSIDVQIYHVDANYQYYAVPKLDKNAFLLAYIIDWEQYNLMEGEANIFFEDTYIGKTVLDVRYTSDTLELSLGRDKNVSISREKLKNYTTKQFVGTKKEITRSWVTTIKNNKNQKIDIVIYDQLPVSTLEEIEVTVKNSSGAEIEDDTGIVKWKLGMKSAESMEKELTYSVKYPKNRVLIVE